MTAGASIAPSLQRLRGCRDVLHRQQDQASALLVGGDSPGIQQKGLVPHGREIVLYPETVELRLLGKDFLQELPQSGDVPLPPADLI